MDEPTCRWVDLPDGTRVRVLGTGQPSDVALAAIADLVAAARRLSEGEELATVAWTFEDMADDLIGELRRERLIRRTTR